MPDAARLLCCGFAPDRRAEIDELIDRGLGGVVLYLRGTSPAGRTRWRR